MKKLLAVTLCVTLLCAGGLPLLAEPLTGGQNLKAGEEESGASGGVGLPMVPANHVGREAVVRSSQVKEGAGTVLVKTTGEEEEEIQLHVDEHTVIMDNQSGLPVPADQIKAGDRVYVYHGPAMTFSLPPQTYAAAILVNLVEGSSPAHLLAAEEVIKGSDGSVTVACDGGGMMVTLPADLPVRPLYTKNIVTNQDVILGTNFFAWYDMVALSYPGRAQATKAVILPAAGQSQVTMYLKNDVPAGIEAKVEKGVVMVPLRATAEALGLSVEWSGREKTVTVAAKDSAVLLKLGLGDCTMLDSGGGNAGDKVLLTAAPELSASGQTWAPAEIFPLLLGRGAMRFVNGSLYFPVDPGLN